MTQILPHLRTVFLTWPSGCPLRNQPASGTMLFTTPNRFPIIRHQIFIFARIRRARLHRLLFWNMSPISLRTPFKQYFSWLFATTHDATPNLRLTAFICMVLVPATWCRQHSSWLAAALMFRGVLHCYLLLLEPLLFFAPHGRTYLEVKCLHIHH